MPIILVLNSSGCNGSHDFDWGGYKNSNRKLDTFIIFVIFKSLKFSQVKKYKFASLNKRLSFFDLFFPKAANL